MTIDGGLLRTAGCAGGFRVVQRRTLPIVADPNSPNVSTPRRLNVTLPNLNGLSGLYPVSVTNNNASPSTAYTNIAVIPDYANTNKPDATPTLIALPAGAAPGAIAFDNVLGVAVLPRREPARSSLWMCIPARRYCSVLPFRLEVFRSSTAPGSLPTGVAVDETLHIASGGELCGSQSVDFPDSRSASGSFRRRPSAKSISAH